MIQPDWNVKMIRQTALGLILVLLFIFSKLSLSWLDDSWSDCARSPNHQVQVKIINSGVMGFYFDRCNNVVCLCTVGLIYECYSTLSPPCFRLYFDFPVINNALLSSVLHLFPVVISLLLNKLWMPVQPAAHLFFSPFVSCCISFPFLWLMFEKDMRRHYNLFPFTSMVSSLT